MSGGLVALLDDVALIAKLAAASVDDIGAAAGKASLKAVGVVVDDTAVTPRYVTGFTPDRELPIIKRIAIGSLRNKIIMILPVALLLSQFLPQAITPILMLGALYLCYEGAEKVYEALSGGHHEEGESAAAAQGTREHEQQMVAGAIRTDFILSAEIMAIALSEVADQSLGLRAASLIAVAVLITALVYGVVALIVKMDDIGLRLARSGSGLAGFGRGLVKGMPLVLSALATIGTAAMLWVGGHILIVGLEELGIKGPAHLLHDLEHRAEVALPAAASFVKWLVETVVSGIVGLTVGAIIVAVMHFIPKRGAAAH
ncbi:DUF808 domain-containing protein [Deinococcus fonticola]|uniref:DUF808 domain-containing protein n=1 Tax=Deinococcus fonticola TaxID=2528713 RepID=UPI00107505E5|nr:DUF808 domain-containing protein [Deinococcus fonticola]